MVEVHSVGRGQSPHGDGYAMSKGTSSGLLDTPRAQSVFKHAILDSYIMRFAVMTASRIEDRRAVLVDGFAGRGRYDDGTPASGEHLLIAAQRAKSSTRVQVVLVERTPSDFRRLSEVADEYRRGGIEVDALLGDVQDHIPAIIQRANGAPLFLFLDPCGANLPFLTLVRILRTNRAHRWPPTEALLNISADLTRRAAGAVNKGLHDHEAVPVMNKVFGGTWWKKTALEAHESSAADDWESAAEAVVAEYALRLGNASRMTPVVAPVRRKAHHQPVYHLVFLTRKLHGLWVFGDAVATARRAWLKAVGPSDDEAAGMLFNVVEDQLASDQERAIRIVVDNVTRLVSTGVRGRLVDHTTDVLGAAYCIADDSVVRKAMRQLITAETFPIDASHRQVRDWRIG
jgi:three-Cys-motif partner protein